MIVTIDGPSGTGKSTVARRVAEKLGFVYFDTGAMYRAFTWFVLQRGIDIADATALQRCLKAFDFRIEMKNREKHYFVGDKEVTEAIREHIVTQNVSAVSAIAMVRTSLLEVQHHFGKEQNAVFEG